MTDQFPAPPQEYPIPFTKHEVDHLFEGISSLMETDEGKNSEVLAALKRKLLRQTIAITGHEVRTAVSESKRGAR